MPLPVNRKKTAPKPDFPVASSCRAVRFGVDAIASVWRKSEARALRDKRKQRIERTFADQQLGILSGTICAACPFFRDKGHAFQGEDHE
ncbi:hypothetical protein [Mesorhizobium sp. M0208]|uniref:hypothetical protein n=1 Tax=unclassified Mesorhizobium TaxID=325217 RepID=UPI00333D1D65